MTKNSSDHYASINDVSIRDLLDGIHAFHECEKWLGQGHAYIRLCSDGSGSVFLTRGGGEIFQFDNLKELVAESKRLQTTNPMDR